MTGRADRSLQYQLDQTEQEAVADDVKAAIRAVVQHMYGSQSRNPRGGRALVRLLEIARLRASEESEWHVVRLLQDSIDYATGRILYQDFTERYRLYEDAARSTSNRNYLAGTIHAALSFTKKSGLEFLAQHPEATHLQLLDHLTTLGQDAQFLEAPADQPGRYRIVRGRAEVAGWIERALRLDRIDIEEPAAAAHRIVTSPQAVQMLASDKDGQTLLKALELKKRADSLVGLRNVVDDPAALESDLQQLLEDKHWIFGGQFVSVADRRQLLPDSVFDIPLIRGDGSLHVVEIKKAMGVRGIVKRHRNAWQLNAEVHDAIGQATNYLVGLDENRAWVREKYGVDAQRASATVLIGHPAVHPHIPEEQISEVLRTFNTHHTRIDVITYKELVDSAERSLRL